MSMNTHNNHSNSRQGWAIFLWIFAIGITLNIIWVQPFWLIDVIVIPASFFLAIAFSVKPSTARRWLQNWGNFTSHLLPWNWFRAKPKRKRNKKRGYR